jgi:DNA topoisomerase III
MKKSIIIAEKPDQAKSFYLPMLEKLSGEEFTQKNGYFESNSYYITWFFGHLLEQLMPDEYENGKYKEWKIEHLPIIPKKMIYRFKGPGQQKQGQLIMSL